MPVLGINELHTLAVKKNVLAAFMYRITRNLFSTFFSLFSTNLALLITISSVKTHSPKWNQFALSTFTRLNLLSLSCGLC